MKYLLSILLVIIMQQCAVCQVIPEDRRIDWAKVSNHISIEQPQFQLNVKDFGAVGDGITNDHQSIADAIESLNGSLGYIYFPSGTYLINEPLILNDSCILKGTNSNESTLIFDLGGIATNCISISKSQSSVFTEITGGYNKGNNLITVSEVDNFSVGDYIEIRQKNGSWDIVPISWADYSVGQFAKILSIIGNKLLINSNLHIDYSQDLEPEVRPVDLISNSGVQCLKIIRRDEPVEGAGANINIYMAANCFVRGIESDTSVGAHVSVHNSLNILIDGCYFHDAFTFDGVGMRGYGVALSQHTSECLITNNIFRNLRHAMMIKTGSNGNIFSYNYSLEPHRSEPVSDASGDISFHGHYAFSNLWEGNIVQNIIIDHYWGPSGPYNTSFRNRAELWGIIMTTNDLFETNKQNFVGNEVTSTEFLHGLYNLTGEDHFEFGNSVLGNIIPAGTTNLPDNSYYLDDKPDFWGQFLEWPSVGIPGEPGSGTIPAKDRYEDGYDFTVCPDSIITNVVDHKIDGSYLIDAWPVPANAILNIRNKSNNNIIGIMLMDQYGRVVNKFDFDNISGKTSLYISQLKNGIYFLKARTLNSTITKKIIIAH